MRAYAAAQTPGRTPALGLHNLASRSGPLLCKQDVFPRPCTIRPLAGRSDHLSAYITLFIHHHPSDSEPHLCLILHCAHAADFLAPTHNSIVAPVSRNHCSFSLWGFMTFWTEETMGIVEKSLAALPIISAHFAFHDDKIKTR